MIRRHISAALKKAASKYPVVAVTGPRQSGKTTLCMKLFKDYAYVNLEKPDERRFATEDPNGFLARFKKPVIFDEIQRAPELFSYLMPIIDSNKKPGRFILTGSQNFLLMESISQTLAGRCAIFHLLPFSLREITGNSIFDVLSFASKDHIHKPESFSLAEHLHKGGFPPVYDRGYSSFDWFGQYTQTYLERDVRTLLNIGDIETFERFLRLCAGRAGQILNLSSLASDCGISVMTAKRWISVLKASFTVSLLRPHYKNFSKRLIKSPKLYFYDTGLLCYLLGIRNADELLSHSMRGAIFESFIVSEITKACFNTGVEPPIYYWRDSTGHEIDLIIEKREKLLPVEIKSGCTIASDMFQNLKWWLQLSGMKEAALVYGGDDQYIRESIKVCPWFYV